jgi:hypothetical protein
MEQLFSFLSSLLYAGNSKIKGQSTFNFSYTFSGKSNLINALGFGV